MKFKLISVVFWALLSGSFSANAICTGCTPGQGGLDPDLEYLYHYEAEVRYIAWYINESGLSATRWQYLTFSGTTLQYCQQQLNSVLDANVFVIRHCTRVRNR